MAILTRKQWLSLSDAALPALAVMFVAVFAGFAIFGSNGVLAWSDYSRQLVSKRSELLKIERDRTALANRVSLLNPQHADPDLVDEMARSQLGVAKPDEVIVPLK